MPGLTDAEFLDDRAIERFDIAVCTSAWLVGRDCKRLMWSDRMDWHDVDARAVKWFAGSCKAALGWYINYPEVVGDVYYCIEYDTIIQDERGREVAGTVHGAELARLDYAGLVSFQRFALDQLDELLKNFEQWHGKPPLQIGPRSRFGSLLRLLWGAVRAA